MDLHVTFGSTPLLSLSMLPAAALYLEEDFHELFAMYA